MRSVKASFLAPLILVLIVAVGCSRQSTVLSPSQAPVSHPQLPFESSSEEGGISPTGSLGLSTLPPGTVLAIRTKSALSSGTAHAGDSFEGVLDEPIVLQGQTVLPRGIRVTGRIVAANSSGQSQEPGYLRLVLSAISTGGKSVRVQTSSVFLKGGSRQVRDVAFANSRAGGGAMAGPVAQAIPNLATTNDAGQKEVEFPAASLLSFRLTQALTLQD